MSEQFNFTLNPLHKEVEWRAQKHFLISTLLLILGIAQFLLILISPNFPFNYDTWWIQGSVAVLFVSFGAAGVYGRKPVQKLYAYEKMSKFPDPIKTEELLNKEIASKSEYSCGDWEFKRNFIIGFHFYSVVWFHYSEINYVHMLRTRHSTNLVPTGSTFGVCVYFPDYMITFNCKRSENDAKKLFELLHQKAPFAIFGYHEDINQANELIKHVAEQRKEYYKTHDFFIKDDENAVGLKTGNGWLKQI